MSKQPPRKPFNIVLPVALHLQAKVAAALSRMTVSAFVEEAVRVALEKKGAK